MPKSKRKTNFKSNTNEKKTKTIDHCYNDQMSKLIRNCPKAALKVFSYLTFKDIENCQQNGFPVWTSFIEENMEKLDLFQYSWLAIKGHSVSNLRSQYQDHIESNNIKYWKVHKDKIFMIEDNKRDILIKILSDKKVKIAFEMKYQYKYSENMTLDCYGDVLIVNTRSCQTIYLIKDLNKIGEMTTYSTRDNISISTIVIINSQIHGVSLHQDCLFQLDMKDWKWNHIGLPSVNHPCDYSLQVKKVFGNCLVSVCDHLFVSVTNLETKTLKSISVEHLIDLNEAEPFSLGYNFFFGFHYYNDKVAVLWPLERTNDFSILVTLHNLDNEQLIWSEIFQCDGFFKHEVTFNDNFIIITRHFERQLRVIIHDLKSEILREVSIPTMYMTVPKSIYILRDQILILAAIDRELRNAKKCSIFALGISNLNLIQLDISANITAKDITDPNDHSLILNIQNQNSFHHGILDMDQDQCGFVYQCAEDNNIKHYSIRQSCSNLFK